MCDNKTSKSKNKNALQYFACTVWDSFILQTNMASTCPHVVGHYPQTFFIKVCFCGLHYNNYNNYYNYYNAITIIYLQWNVMYIFTTNVKYIKSVFFKY